MGAAANQELRGFHPTRLTFGRFGPPNVVTLTGPCSGTLSPGQGNCAMNEKNRKHDIPESSEEGFHPLRILLGNAHPRLNPANRQDRQWEADFSVLISRGTPKCLSESTKPGGSRLEYEPQAELNLTLGGRGAGRDAKTR